MNDKDLYKYIDTFRSKTDPLIGDLERQTHLHTLSPQMSSGPFQGKVLELISLMLRPTHILEIGTFTGVSTLCLAKGLSPKGKIITIDPDEETTLLAKRYFEKSHHKDQIEIIIGDAKHVIPNLTQKFDLIFIDADKDAYIQYYNLLIDRLSSGAVILADNTLWYGKVWAEKKDRKTQILHDFNVLVANDDRVENVILPIRDGINLIRVK